MKLLIIATHVLSDALGSGGDIMFIELARRWQRMHLQVHVLLAAAGFTAYSQACHPAASLNLPGTWLDNPHRYFGRSLLIALVYLGRAIRTVAQVRSLHPDFLYTPGDFWCDVLPAALKKRTRPTMVWAAAVFHVNESPWRRHGNSRLATLLSWLAQRASFVLIKKYADVVFALNRRVKSELLTKGFVPERVHVLGAGVDKIALKKIPAMPPRYAACYIGRINPTKGVFALPAIWQRVVKKVPDSQLLIIGQASSAWEKQLHQAITNAGVQPHVLYKGYIASTEELRRYLKQSRLFITASTEEGFGISIAEALTLGIPAVAYDLPAYHEFFPRGLLTIPPGQTDAFAETVSRLLTDATFYRQHSIAAQQAVADYDWDHVATTKLAVMKQARWVC